MSRRDWLLWLPLAVFVGLASTFVLGLRNPASRTITSRMVGAEVPDFTLPVALPGQPSFSARDLKGRGPHLVNFFASWCVPCAAEAPMLAELKASGVPIVGIAVRDRPGAVAAFLDRYGNPYQRIGGDPQGKIQMAFGASGVPETYVVDGQGMIRLQIIGPVSPQQLDELRAALKPR